MGSLRGARRRVNLRWAAGLLRNGRLGVLLALVATAPGLAHGKPLGEIAGRLTSVSGTALAGRAISLRLAGGGAPVESAMTDATGQYRFAAVPYGRYVLAVALAKEPGRVVELSASRLVEDLRTSGVSAGAVTGPTGKARAFQAGGAGQAVPMFRPSGVHGTTAPSGYSGGASEEDAEQLRRHTAALGTDVLLLTGMPLPACEGQPLGGEAAAPPTDHDTAERVLGLRALMRGDNAEAARRLEAAREMKPGDGATDRVLALVYLRLHRFAEARTLLKGLPASVPADATLELLSAEVFAGQGATDLARREYVEAGSTRTSPAVAYAGGLGLLRLGLPVEAGGLLRRALDLWPGSHLLAAGLGTALASSGEKSAALPLLLGAVSGEPQETSAYPVLARLTGVTPALDQQIVETVRMYAAAHPEDAEAHYDMAIVLWRTRRRDPAVREAVRSELFRSLTLQPDRSDAHLLLGTVDAEDGRKADAVRELEASLSLTPDSAQAHYRLALLDRNLGRPAASEWEMRRFLALRSEGEAMDGIAPPTLVAAEPDAAPRPCSEPDRPELR